MMRNLIRRLAAVAALAAFLELTAGPAWSAELTATHDTAKAVLAEARSGDVVRLEGRFGLLQLTARAFSPALTVDATDATLTAVMVRDVKGLAWKGGLIRPKDQRRGFTVTGSEDVALEGIAFEGDGLTDAFFFDASRAVSLTSSRIEKARGAVALRNVERGRIEGNHVWRWTANGISLESTSYSVISMNSFVARMKVDDVHPDGIQGMQSKARPNHHLLISGNYFGGDDTQGIFMQKAWEGYAQAHDIRIVGNTVVTSNAPNGIILEGDPAGIVTGNRVATLPGSKWQTQIRTDAPTRTGNEVAAYGRWPALTDPPAPQP